jgi:hypothetical protein
MWMALFHMKGFPPAHSESVLSHSLPLIAHEPFKPHLNTLGTKVHVQTSI